MKNFISRTWQDLSTAGRIVIGIWILCIIALISFLVIRNNDKDSSETADDKQAPEIAQVYEPSIGSPLPADTPTETNWDNVGNTGTVAGDSTAIPSTNNDQAAPTEIKIAPNAGVNPNAPIAYESSALKFHATLPAGSNVNDSQADKVTFTNKQGNLLYIVSTQKAESETLKTIEAQLGSSPSVSNISGSSFAGQQALKFSTKEYGSGVAFISKGKIYYLFGDSKQFATFKIL